MRALRRLLPFLTGIAMVAAPVAVTLTPAVALADDVLLGTIVSSGSSTSNLTTATKFALYAKTKVSVQCDAAAYVVEASADTGTGPTATSSNGVKLSADQLFDIALGMGGSATLYGVAIIPVSGSANCKVFQST